MAHILLVEDSEYLRKVIAFSLKQAGYEVSCAENGEVALALAAEQTFDLLVTDLNMPVMDGPTLITHIKGLAGYNNVAVICITTETSLEELPESVQALIQAIVTKPYNPVELLEQVSLVLA